MQTTDLVPKYAHISFKSPEEFEAWLKETTKYEVELFDDGQDLIKFWIAENMEIIHAATGIAAHLYNGRFVINGVPLELGMLQVCNPLTNEQGYIRYQIEKVTTHEVLLICTSCEGSFDSDVMKEDCDSNYFCNECYNELAPQMEADYKHLKLEEIENNVEPKTKTDA